MELTSLKDIERLNVDNELSVFRVDHIAPYCLQLDIGVLEQMSKNDFKKKLIRGDYYGQDCGCDSHIRSFVFLAPKKSASDLESLNLFGKTLCDSLENSFELTPGKIEPPDIPSPPYYGFSHPAYFYPARLVFSQKLISFKVPVIDKKICSSHVTSLFVFPSSPPSSVAFKGNYRRISNNSYTEPFDLTQWFKGSFYEIA